MIETTEARRTLKTTIRTFMVLLLIMLSLLSLVCYLNFDQNYRAVKQSTYALMCEQVTSDMETSIEYGKRIDRYYGIDAVLERTQTLFAEGVMNASVLDDTGKLLYTSLDEQNAEWEILQSRKTQNLAANLSQNESYELVAESDYEAILLPINDGDHQAGTFVLTYPTSVYDSERVQMLSDVVKILVVALVAGIFILWLYSIVLSRRLLQMSEERQRIFTFGVTTAILMAVILVCGMTNFLLFQNRYEAAIEEDAISVVHYVEDATQSLYEKGVAYEEMEGLEHYLADKILNLPVLENLRITHVVSDSNMVLDSEIPNHIQVEMTAGDETLFIEAVISEDYVHERLQELFLLYLAIFVFSTVIIFEMTKLPAMLNQRSRKTHGHAGDAGTFAYISSSIRIMTFLRTFGNYMYVPYSALLIKQWEQAVGSFSVGVTAALPLSVEGAAQMIGLLLFPGWIKRPDNRARMFFSVCFIGMILINVGCFLTHSALVIIVLRFFGGIAYAGFMYTINMVVANGYDDEKRHQMNLSQSNAGIIGGNMCGAGIGALIAALAGYSFSYIASAIVYVVFGVFVLKMLPWRFLEENALKKEKEMETRAEKVPVAEYVRLFFSPGVLRYFVLIMVPVFFGVLFTATLIPTMNAQYGSELLLSYCYIANGLAGFYLGPVVVKSLSGRVSVQTGLSAALVLGAAAIFILEVPPFAVMVLLSSALLGVFDGYGSPIATDGFLAIPRVKENVSEVTALALYMTLSSLVMTVAPVLIESLTQISMSVAVFVLAGVYLACAIAFATTSGVGKLFRRHKE